MLQPVMDWLRWGSNLSPSFSHRRKILQLNATAVMTFGVLVGFSIAYLASGNPALLRMALFQLPVMVITAAIPWLNRRGQHDLARWGLLLSVTGLIAAGTWLSSGRHLRIHAIHIVIAMAGVVLFPPQGLAKRAGAHPPQRGAVRLRGVCGGDSTG